MRIVLSFAKFAAGNPENGFWESEQSFIYMMASPLPALRFVAWIFSRRVSDQAMTFASSDASLHVEVMSQSNECNQ